MTSPGTFDDERVREEVFSAARICAPCMDHLGQLTFSGAPRSIGKWKNSVFSRHLLPAVLEGFEATRTGGARELGCIDHRLDAALATPLATRSRAAGRILTLEYKAPAGERAVERYSQAVAKGIASGHFVTIFAARAVVFHIPPPTAVAALVLIEFRPLMVAGIWEAVSEAMADLPVFPHLLRAA